MASTRARVLGVVALVLSLGVLGAGLVVLAFWRSATGQVEGHADLVLVGRIARVGMTKSSDRVDAVEETIEPWHFVRFDVERVVRGSWSKPDIGVAVHSPSFSFRAHKGSTGARHVLTFQERTLAGGRTVLVFQGSAPCLWRLPPCGGAR